MKERSLFPASAADEVLAKMCSAHSVTLHIQDTLNVSAYSVYPA